MTDPAFEQDLLLGLSAVRNDLMEEARFLAAVRAWAADKSGPLSAALLREGLSPADAAALGPLVALHAEQHGGTRQSLAALSSAGDLYRSLRDMEDTQVSGTLPPAAEPSGTLPPGGPPGRVEVEAAGGGNRYRVIRPHAEGGLGRVSVAEDLELGREVALKQIKGPFADNCEARSRFLLEAEVTARLQHPSVVPIYGLGRDAEGRPYYAMRFVEGRTLRDAADEFRKSGEGFDSVAFRGLLGRFVDVCQAVAYAHDRGVLHRDLKPGNVMLGDYGETLVVDWGLAKVAGAAEAAPDAPACQADAGPPEADPASAGGSRQTRAGQVIGTPGFMPPEQAAGRLADVGVASDVYALGATLYYVLCGRPPASAGPPGPPREVRGDVPRSLAAVCAKATADAPADRYATPADLAAECERWLADEPVTARRESPLGRARRVLRKHSSAAVAASLVVLLTLAGTAAAASALSHKNGQLRAAKADADRARAAAEDQSRLALDTLTGVITDVQAEVADLPRGSSLRTRLLSRTLENVRRLADPLLQGGAADDARMRALFDLSELLLEVGDAGGGGAESPAALSLRFATEALAIAERRADPASADTRHDLARAFDVLGTAHEYRSEVAEAERAYARMLQITERLAQEDPESTRTRRHLAIALQRVGDVHKRRGRYAEMLAVNERSLAVERDLLRENPTSDYCMRGVSVGLGKIGQALEKLNRPGEALRRYEEKLAINRRRLAAAPQSVERRCDVSVALQCLGDLYEKAGDYAAAAASHAEAVAIDEALAAASPRNVELQHNLAISLACLASVRLKQGREADYLALEGRALELDARAAAADPQHADRRRSLSITRLNLSLAEAARGDAAALGAAAAAAGTLVQESLKTGAVLPEFNPGKLWQFGRIAVSGGGPQERTAAKPPPIE